MICKQPVDKTTQPEKKLQLEGLRGFAALWVFAGHTFAWETFSPKGKMLPPLATGWLAGFTPGHLGVLFFFILSGYVMGTVYPHDKYFSWKQYLLKRWVRIWPMYAFAVVISCLLIPAAPRQFLGNLLFLNPHISYPIPGDIVLWSVSYEFGFYLIFPIIFLNRFLSVNKAIPLLISTVGISLISFIFINNELYPIFYWINGLSLWLLGLYIAWVLQPKNSSFDSPDSYTILPHILIVAALSSAIASPIYLPSVADFLYLPSILSVFFNLIKIKISRQTEFILFSFPLILVFAILWDALIKGSIWAMPNCSVALLLAVAAVVLRMSPVHFDLTTLAPVGAISYGIYIYHMPIMHLIAKIPFLGGGWIEWCIRLTITIFLVLSFSYVIEIQLQPKIRSFFLKSILFK